MNEMKLTSPVFENKAAIPAKYSCAGQDINPPLEISGVPQEAKSLALVVSDPDAPAGLWIHWVMWNIEPTTTSIAEDSVPRGAIQGSNSWGKKSYGGPCPPSGTHRYFFRLYALKHKIELSPAATAQVLEQAIRNSTIATAELMGTFTRRQE
ncbi:YbhB/YbcL family Raf kinase inhibitor-like protein [Geomonas sp. RF6]|uniref:YbhB/YbcL family Raf kinase inhibitor-like protein n=1 Tax=Geomonas sp. RF6 TaxID=2897342 RepID=UPI001E53708C|nr:YbhB/YbcL family Raf kinase inhibitor-like protein [Geomonas sp. RF6]UFS70260.1 YbhB/YbcL family Raf kinase inhibitor-like protein [Geomonas sp. RF6]